MSIFAQLVAIGKHILTRKQSPENFDKKQVALLNHVFNIRIINFCLIVDSVLNILIVYPIVSMTMGPRQKDIFPFSFYCLPYSKVPAICNLYNHQYL